MNQRYKYIAAFLLLVNEKASDLEFDSLHASLHVDDATLSGLYLGTFDTDDIKNKVELGANELKKENVQYLQLVIDVSGGSGPITNSILQTFPNSNGLISIDIKNDIIPVLDEIIDLKGYYLRMEDCHLKGLVKNYLINKGVLDENGIPIEDGGQQNDELGKKWKELEDLIVAKAISEHQELINAVHDGKEPQSILIQLNTLMSRVSSYIYNQINENKDNIVIRAYHDVFKKLI